MSCFVFRDAKFRVGRYEDHKTRGYETVTFGAPVLIDGVRMNLVVVVSRANGNNKYKVHRMLFEDGSTIKEKRNRFRLKVVGDNASLAATIDSDKKNITDASTGVARKNRTPGGVASVRNTISNYDDAVKTSREIDGRTGIDEESVKQETSSAGTSIKQIPALFRDKKVTFGKTNIDIGGGKYDLATNYLAEQGVTNMVFDPYKNTMYCAHRYQSKQKRSSGEAMQPQ